MSQENNNQLQISKKKPQKHKTSITPILNEILFKMWMAGKSPSELIEIYEGTGDEFTQSSLHRAMIQYSWKERREAILAKVREGVDEEIELFTSKKLKTIHHIMSITSDQIQREYQNFLKNPDDPYKRPSWLPSTMKDLDLLYRLHDFIVSGGVEKHAIGLKNADKAMAEPLPENIATQMLKLLAEASTKEMIAKSTNTIEAEFVEASQDETIMIKPEDLLKD